MYYCTRTPVAVNDGELINKNYIYWESIANVLQNKPYLNEIEEYTNKLKNRIDSELQKPYTDKSYNKVKSLRDELRGARTSLGILRTAHDKEIQLRQGT